MTPTLKAITRTSWAVVVDGKTVGYIRRDGIGFSGRKDGQDVGWERDAGILAMRIANYSVSRFDLLEVD